MASSVIPASRPPYVEAKPLQKNGEARSGWCDAAKLRFKLKATFLFTRFEIFKTRRAFKPGLSLHPCPTEHTVLCPTEPT